MFRRRLFPSLLVHTLLLSVLLLSVATTALADQPSTRSDNRRAATDPLWYPTLNLPNDTAFVWCDSDSICYEISATDPDANDTLVLELVSGPIEFEPREFGNEFTTTACFLPQESGDYTFVWKLTDIYDHVVIDTVTFSIELGPAPVIEDQQFFAELCDLREPRRLQLTAEGTGLVWEMVSGQGTIDPELGILVYQPDTSGIFTFTVAISNICGSDTATITDQVVLNLPPYCFPYDTTVFLCDPEEICFEILAEDPEGDPVTIELLEGIGTFEQTSDTSGITCFMPADQAQAVYRFIFFTADSCVLAQDADLSPNPECCVDTVRVEVIIAQGGELTCPGDTAIDLCVPPDNLPELVCIPGFASTWETTETSFGQLNGDTLCFSPDTLGTYIFKIIGSDSCGHSDTCFTAVTLSGNEPPVVVSPESIEAEFCLPDFYCFNVAASDPDGEIVDVSPSLGTFDGELNEVCFYADTAGTYEVVVTVTDNCGATSSDTTVVVLTPVAPPSISLGEDFSTTLCESAEVCVDVILNGGRIEQIMPSIGTYDEQTGQVCFTPDTSGTYTLVVEVYDDCNNMTADTVSIDVLLNQPPVVTGGNDTSLVLCQPQEICLPFAVVDPDDNELIVTTNLGVYADGQVCFLPEGDGVYEIVVTATDQCEITSADTVVVTVDVGEVPTISNFNDTTIYLCYPRQVCLTPEISDPDGDIVSIQTSFGTYTDGSICFVPYRAGLYTIVLTVIDECENVAVDTAVVEIQTDEAVELVCPGDTTVFLCEPDTLCFPIQGIPEGAEVTVGGIATYWDAENQTVCFFSDCCLENTVTVTATTACGSYSCSFTVDVQTNSAPLVLMPNDTSVFLCDLETFCVPVGISDIDGNIASIDVEGGTYDDYENTVCITPETTGEHTVTVIVTDSCGAIRTDEMTVNVRLNSAPELSLVNPDQVFRVCELQEIEISFNLIDLDSNVIATSSPDGDITFAFPTDPAYQLGFLYFTPTQFGENCFTIVATDACGLTDTLNACVIVEQGSSVAIICPMDVGTVICEPGQVCFELPIEGDIADVTTSIGSWVDGQFCVDVTESIETTVTLIAEGECNTDTCEFALDITLLEAPDVECPGDVTVALCEPDTLSFALGLSHGVDQFYNVTVTQPAWVSSDAEGVYVNVPVLSEGSQTISVVYTADGCAADTCLFTIDASLNTPPVVEAEDATFRLCDLEEVCVPYNAFDIDGNLDSVYGAVDVAGDPQRTTGSMNRDMQLAGLNANEVAFRPAGSNQICFTPEEFGDYILTITAVDTCGAETSVSVLVSVMQGNQVSIECPVEQPLMVCDPGTTCISLPIVGEEFAVSTSLGTWNNDTLCVELLEPGLYNVTVVAQAECNTDTCEVSIQVKAPATVECPGDIDMFLCNEQDTLVTVPVAIEGDDVEVTVTPEGAVYADGLVSVPVTGEGSILVTVTATNACSEASCSFTIDVAVNDAPFVILGEDQTITLCTLEEVCLPYEVTDTEGNVVEIRTSLGVVNGDQICITPQNYGDYQIVVTAIDSCGAEADDTLNISIVQGVFVEIDCPTGTLTADINVPDTIRVPIAITPADGVEVSVTPDGYYDLAAQELVAYVENTGTFDYQIVALAECNADTCDVSVEVRQYIPPVVDCIGSVDTALCLIEPDTLCLPVTISGSNVEVMVSEPAYYTDGFVCLPVSEPGEYTIEITAYNSEDTATCTSFVVVTGGNPPMLIMPDDFSTVLCDRGEVCFDVTIQDTDFDISFINVSYGSYDIETGQLCFEADSSGTYEIVVTVGDDCDNTVTDTTLVSVMVNQAPLVSLGEDIEVFQCQADQVCVDVTIEDDGQHQVTTNLGTFDAETSEVCFLPEGPGTYELIVTVVDDCEIGVSDTLLIDVEYNEPPLVSGMQDTTVYLCRPTQVCLSVDIFDVNGNIETVTSNRGSVNGEEVCFVPYGMGMYEVIVTATDSCGLMSSDTAYVEVLTDQSIELVCPDDTTVFLCEPDTLCFPIYGIPDGAEVSVDGIATYWDAASQSICFFSDCCLENELTVTITTPCGSYSCSFTVYVQTNTPPLVFLPTDTTIIQCALQPVCLPLGVNDIDGNLADVSVTYGEYDDYANRVCFTPDTAGTYVIGVTAIDSCGGVREDQIAVTIQLNEAPVISYTSIDTTLKQCEPEEVCIPVEIIDPDNNLVSVTVDGGTYNEAEGVICIMPDGVGTFCAAILAMDACGLETIDTICIDVELGDYVTIECPVEPIPEIVLCEADMVCIELPVTGTDFEVSVSNGSWQDGQLCFLAQTSGTYEITVIAAAQCNSDTCQLSIPVTILEPLSVTCPPDDTPFLCAPDTLCYEFAFTPAGANVTVSEPAYISGSQVCVPVFDAGTQNITLTVSNQCGEVSCSFSVQSSMNSDPVVSLGADVSDTVCELSQVCIPISASDVDENIATTETNIGEVSDGQVCFTPETYGSYSVIVTVTDECGASDADTVVVNIVEGSYASIQCPDGAQFASVCGPDSVCILAPITPANAKVTILPNGSYNPETGEICVYVTQGGTQAVTVVAEAQCSSDTCEFNLEVDFGIPPTLTCPGEIDTLLCLVEPTDLCFPIEVSGTGVQVNVNPAGEFQAGVVCVPISEPGEYTYQIIATGTCGADTCSVTVNVAEDQPPTLVFPAMPSFERCPDDTNTVCVSGIYATDSESEVTISQVCGPEGAFNAVQPDSGVICFVPEEFGMIEFCFEYTDGCHVDTGSFFVNIELQEDCDVCVRLSIDGGDPTPVGLRKEVAINIEANDAIGGFDVLLSYDKSALSFQNARISGGAAEDWEYFTWNLNVPSGPTSTGLVRLVGIADRNNGAAHPPESAYTPEGTLFFIEFLVANDQNLGGLFVPVSFYWVDCTDNTFSDRTGRILYMDSRIFNPEGVLIWDEFDEVNYPESNRFAGVGAADSCIVPNGDKPLPLRCIEFHNGGVQVIDPEEIDDRGDINLNGLSYEIADAVVFTNYFIRGLSAFTINVAGQIAATDVNADGLTLTVSDLTLLIRVIVGDANPIPKVRPYAETAFVTSEISDNMLTISTETVSDLGVAYFVYDLPEGMNAGEPQGTFATSGFTFKYSIENGQLKVLMYDIGTSVVAPGRNELCRIPLIGEGEVRLTHSELADYQGQPYNSSARSALPANFVLMQNYPNPFNPTTTISFVLPQAGQWNLKVYNINGALVTEYEGNSAGGQVDVVWDGLSSDGGKVASGVYFYRLDALTYSETRKMVLLK